MSETTSMPEAAEVEAMSPSRREQLELYCEDCSNGRTKIIRGGRDFNDVSPCPTCRPAQYRTFMRRRDRQLAKKK